MISCGDVLGPMIDPDRTSIRLSHLSLLKYSFNLNPAIHKLISIELGELMTDYELRICSNRSSTLQSPMATNDALFSSVLQSNSIQHKNEVVIGSKTNNLFLQQEQIMIDKSGKFVSSSSSQHHEMLNKYSDDSTKKLLSEMSAIDVGYLLESLDLGEYKGSFLKNKIDGTSLQHCEKVEEVREMGISMTVKARFLFKQIRNFQKNGVPVKHFESSIRYEVSLSNKNTIS